MLQILPGVLDHLILLPAMGSLRQARQLGRTRMAAGCMAKSAAAEQATLAGELGISRAEQESG